MKFRIMSNAALLCLVFMSGLCRADNNDGKVLNVFYFPAHHALQVSVVVDGDTKSYTVDTVKLIYKSNPQCGAPAGCIAKVVADAESVGFVVNGEQIGKVPVSDSDNLLPSKAFAINKFSDTKVSVDLDMLIEAMN